MSDVASSRYAASLYAERYVTPLVTVRRRRTLPFPGRLIRRAGDRVAADTLIAETDVPLGYRLIELDKVLGTRVRDARKVMVKRVGDPVQEGEVIARAGVLFERGYASPVEGKILDARDNKVLIETSPRHVALNALYPGLIVEVIPNLGVVIETTGALIQGVWGTGRALRATLQSVVSSVDASLGADQISDEHLGAILLGGRTLNADAIAQAIQSRASAVIVGSISSDLLPTIAESKLSLILTEGFGDFPMDPATFALLDSFAGREACFSPLTRVEYKTQRPEVFVYMPVEGRPPLTEPATSLSVGTRVRALRAPYENAVGEVVSLPPHPRRLASGVQAWGAEIDLESIGNVFIPLRNLEIIR
jgi:hypothetical protein